MNITPSAITFLDAPSSIMFLNAAMHIGYGGDSVETFRRTFGVHPRVCADIWRDISLTFPEELEQAAAPKHLLWTLLFLRGLSVHHLAALLKTPGMTIRERVWRTVACVAALGGQPQVPESASWYPWNECRDSFCQVENLGRLAYLIFLPSSLLRYSCAWGSQQVLVPCSSCTGECDFCNEMVVPLKTIFYVLC